MVEIFSKWPGYVDAASDMKVKCDSQSLSFYSDLSSFIGEKITGYRHMSLLDVGARTAAGTALLRAIHHPASFARLKLNRVTALDLDEAAIQAAASEYPDLEYLVIDVAKLKGLDAWDIVLASHTIEHVNDPVGFIEALANVAKQYVIIACPFAEQNLSVGHVQRFNMDFFEENGFTDVKVYRSQHWHGGMACIAIKPVG